MQDIVRLILAVILLLCGCVPKAETAQQSPAFHYEGTRIEMHAEAAPILEALGEPESYTEEPSCAFDGLDKTYCYGSFYLTTYPQDGTDYIYSLWFVDDSVTTEEGLRIGDSQEQVENLYKNAQWNGTNGYLISTENASLRILISDEQVSAVVYEAKLP